MPRITKAHKAGLDFLDLVFFNDLVVHVGMDTEERSQLQKVIQRVSQMVECRHSGREADVIKHLIYYILEVSLANTTEELSLVNPHVPRPPSLSSEQMEAVDNFWSDYQMAFMTVVTEKSTGVLANHAFEIAEVLIGEFAAYSPLVRRDLLTRCFVSEFTDASLGVYSWLIVSGVLPVTKHSPDRIRDEFSASFMTRLALLADYQMIVHAFNMMISKDEGSAVYLRMRDHHNLSEDTVDRLLEIQRHFNEALNKKSLAGIPLICCRDLKNPLQVQEFFCEWSLRKVRFRMHTGNLGSWLSILGAGMVHRQLMGEYAHAARIQYPNELGTVNISALKVPAVFNACDNRHTITEFVQGKLSDYGFRINPDTLYRSHSTMRKATLRLLASYCQMTRDLGVAVSAPYEDVCYVNAFIHSDKLS
ncbi:hypothetical protein QO021_29885 (plasmid) [Pseudomonas amygdali pv. lachrymans]|uniref:hypothetical protein n=1 Tax=Pseudomonas amygdali TaxID=47877 RepID=UPI0006B94CD5|nr:hypothetical protein [Pseudomonas amygdali]KPC02095.1 Uncharacterized protein AC501_3381 [Pseudomonas amygdali pv. lachrymans]RMM39351.1 hypothetical protein ALQ79_200350 [Pseudomonas amygdali pv. lachrymans]WIO61299.1 hypothetical protein QO021_29885 [Pseudomonas amygdali pv. lachrymans]